MKLLQVHIENFRILKKIDLEFSKDIDKTVTVIRAANESGKTNLWLNLIKRRRCFYYKQFHKIYIFSNSIHTINEKISLPPEQIIKGFSEDKLQQVIDDEEEEERNRDDDEEPSRVLMIFDDVFKFDETSNDLVRLSASTIEQLFKETDYNLKNVRKTKLVKPISLSLLPKDMKLIENTKRK